MRTITFAYLCDKPKAYQIDTHCFDVAQVAFASSGAANNHHRNLAIGLAVPLGILAALLLFCCCFLLCWVSLLIVLPVSIVHCNPSSSLYFLLCWLCQVLVVTAESYGILAALLLLCRGNRSRHCRFMCKSSICMHPTHSQSAISTQSNALQRCGTAILPVYVCYQSMTSTTHSSVYNTPNLLCSRRILTFFSMPIAHLN